MDGFSTTHLALLLLAAGVLGALLPLQRRWTERGLHLFVALAAGIFLGTIFLHLLPHLAGGEVHEGHDH
ncbi:MAG: Zinc transporter, partial [Planctomycetota bacterium]